MTPTIVALSTGQVNCAIHIIRISGPKTYDIASKLANKTIKPESYKIQKVTIFDENQQVLDDVLLLKFVAPNSYTGEDVIEISCHGSLFVANKIIQRCLQLGAMTATNGEFTKQAFINNKLNLIQAQAINNLINSRSIKTLQWAHKGLSEELKKQISQFEQDLFKLVGLMQVSFDYPEEDHQTKLDWHNWKNKLQAMISQMDQIISDSKQVLPLQHPYKIVIAGLPNCGKSSLLNLLTSSNRALVSNQPGTTRDFITAYCEIAGVLVELIDTAGINLASKDKIEQQGIKLAKLQIKQADLILYMIDQSKPNKPINQKILNQIANKPHLILLNKSDLKANKNQQFSGLQISCKNKKIDLLLEALKQKLAFSQLTSENRLLLQSQAEIDSLILVKQALKDFIKAMDEQISWDLAFEDLKKAYDNLLQLTGKAKNFDFINEIFSKFCVGK